MKSGNCPAPRQHGLVRNSTTASSSRRFFTEREDTIFGLTLQKAGFETALRVKEEEFQKFTAKSASRIQKYEEALKRTDEKVGRLTIDVVEYDAALRAQVKETESMAAKLAAAYREVENFKRMKTENGERIETLNSNVISLRIDKRELKHRLEVALGETKKCQVEMIQLKDRHMRDLEDSLDMITSLKTEVNLLGSQNATKDRIASSEVNKLKANTDRDFAILNTMINDLQKENADESNRTNVRTTKLALERDFWRSKCEEMEQVATEAEALEIASLRRKKPDAEQVNAQANRLESEAQELHHRIAANQAMTSQIEPPELENQVLKSMTENATQVMALGTETGAKVEGWKHEIVERAASEENTSQIRSPELENQKPENTVVGYQQKFSQITILRAGLEQWKQEAGSGVRRGGDMVSQIESLELENQKLRDTCDGAQQNAAQATSSEAELEQEYEERINSEGDTVSQIESLELESQRLENVTDGAQQDALQVAILQAELKSWRRGIEERIVNEKAMTSQIEILESENRILKSELDNVQQKVAQIATLRAEVEQWRRETEEKARDREGMVSQIESLRSENQILESRLDEARQKVAQIAALREEIGQWKRDHEKRVEEESVREMDEWRVHEGARLMEEQRGAVEATLKAFADESGRMKRDLQVAGEDIETLVSKSGELEETIRIQNKEISALQEALCRQRDRNSRDRRESRDQRTEAKDALLNLEVEHEGVVDVLEASLRERNEKLAHLEEALAKKDDELMGVRLCMVEAQQKVTDVTSQYAAVLDGARILRRKLESYKEKLDRYEFKVRASRLKVKGERIENVRTKEDQGQTSCEGEIWCNRGRQPMRRARLA
ncbi:MAG: hypothetical protein M1840_007341 [Geoglossum simile]|nr:MAG: hypothetical protein M1840_007341 [Geoglossum simile]